MDSRRRLRPYVTAPFALSIVLVGCSGAAAPGSPSPSSAPPADATPGRGLGSGHPDDSGSGSGGGGVPGDRGNGILPTDPAGSGVAPDPEATLVFPKPGVIDPKPVFVSGLSSTVLEGRLVVRIEWTSGVEPCYTLAAVTAGRGDDVFTLRVLEGQAGRDVACIEIAQYKATLVDLGELPAGTYTVEAGPGDAAPLTVTIP